MEKNVFPLLMQSRYAILPEAYQSLLQFAEKAMNSPDLASIAKPKKADSPLRTQEMNLGSTAIVPILGPIFSKENFFTLYFGGTALSTFAMDFETAIQDKTVDRIVLFFDSPGGEVTGISEMAQRIFTARPQKQIISYVYGMAASAAYWLASATGKIIMADTAQVGSIGVVAGYTDTRKRDEAAGLSRIEVVSSQSPRKNLDLATDAGKAEVQRIVDQLADIFVNSVALYRGTDTKNVLKNYGQGGILIGHDAVNNGMADEINTLDGILSGRMGTIASGKTNSGTAAISTLEQHRVIAGSSTGLPPVASKIDREAEEFNAMVSNIAAGANQSRQEKAIDPGSDDVGISAELLPAFSEFEEPENESAEINTEELNAMVSGIVAGANEYRNKKDAEPLTDEERRNRYIKSSK